MANFQPLLIHFTLNDPYFGKFTPKKGPFFYPIPNDPFLQNRTLNALFSFSSKAHTRCFHIWMLPAPPGGHWPRNGVWVCAAVTTPFFHTSRRSLAYQFPINAPLMCPPFSNFGKICIFSLVFWPKFQFLRGTISEFSLPRPVIFLWKPAP